MQDEEQLLAMGVEATAGETANGPEQSPRLQRVPGVAGRLRPYRDVRAGFEPWRRLVLREWAAREDAMVVH